MDNSSQFFETDPFLTLNSPLRSSSKQSDAYDNLKETQGQIQKQINAWAELNKVFHKKQQQSFLVTFNEIMERMALELAAAQQKYQNIDLQVKKDERCQRLEKEVHFFRQECLVLRSQVDTLKKQVSSLKFSNQSIKEQSFVLKKKLNKRVEVFAIDKTVTNTAVHSTTAKSFFVPEKSKLQQEDIAIEGLIYNLRSNDPKDGINLLKKFIRNQVKTYQRIQLKKVMKSNSMAKQTSYPASLIETAEVGAHKNQFLELWQECIKEFKINKKLGKQIPKESKFKLLESFLSSQKFIELLRRKIFGEKCCTNWNCLGNLESNPNHDGLGGISPPKRSIQTADNAFRNTKYNRRMVGSNKSKIFHLENHSLWT